MGDALNSIQKKIDDAMTPLDEWSEREAAASFFRRRLNIRDASGKTKIEKLQDNVEELAYDSTINPQVRLESTKFLINLAKGSDDEEQGKKGGGINVPIQININGVDGAKKE